VTDATIIALTPVLNEAWVLDFFLQCASGWADHIVVADQSSDDDSRAIAARYPRVRLIDNHATDYDEVGRQRLLIEAARAIPVEGHRVLVALDADEVLSANWVESPEWDRVRAARPGTVLWFDWVNVTPDRARWWSEPGKVPFGFVDDGREHTGERIHSRRLPVPAGAPSLEFDEIKVLHLQYLHWARMRSKQRWYQCWERLNDTSKRPITIYRQYHHMDAGVARSRPMPPAWTAAFGPEWGSVGTTGEEYFRWDRDVRDMLLEHDVETFRRMAIWDVDWSAVPGAPAGVNGSLADPRSTFDRAVHRWLARTQPTADRLHVRAAQRLLRLTGW
jgi:hypothetical protein